MAGKTLYSGENIYKLNFFKTSLPFFCAMCVFESSVLTEWIPASGPALGSCQGCALVFLSTVSLSVGPPQGRLKARAEACRLEAGLVSSRRAPVLILCATAATLKF